MEYFLRNHLSQTVSMDSLTAPAITIKVLFVFIVLAMIDAECCTSM
jgi:hypothetical protein